MVIYKYIHTHLYVHTFAAMMSRGLTACGTSLRILSRPETNGMRSRR